jgi:hypothetical protein
MSALADRLKKVGHKEVTAMSALFDDSFLMNKVPEVPTAIPALNVALSGKIDGGMTPGILIIAGPSRHFKTLYGLIVAAAYMKKHKDAIMCFYDNEFGAAKSYFDSVGIPTDRVLHCPFTDIEMLKSDIAQKLSSREEGSIKRGEKVLIFIDSIGNVASVKEVKDAEDEKSVADMTRAKALKSFFRIITARLRVLELPFIAINHTYMTQEMYSRAIVSGGTGVMYSANDVWVIGKSQIKDEDGLTGFCFTVNIEKSRRVKEKKKIPIVVKFDGGMNKYSGLLQMGLELGVITKPKLGWLTRELHDPKTGEIIPDRLWRLKEIEADEASFFEDILKKSRFGELVAKAYVVAGGKLINGDDELEEEALPEMPDDTGTEIDQDV